LLWDFPDDPSEPPEITAGIFPARVRSAGTERGFLLNPTKRKSLREVARHLMIEHHPGEK